MDQTLTWDDSYAIALQLMERHPEVNAVNLEEVSLGMIYIWTTQLPEFHDDLRLANDVILSSIYQAWYEEVNPL